MKAIEQLWDDSAWVPSHLHLTISWVVKWVDASLSNELTRVVLWWWQLVSYPERWWIITSLKLGGKELLFQWMLEESLYNLSKSVKWGIPVLFPNAWPLTLEEQSRSGYRLPQHWFARTNRWKVIDRMETSLVQSLHSDDVITHDWYMWSGSITNSIELNRDDCKFDYIITNEWEKPIPISFGMHPYFDVPQGDKTAIQWKFEGWNKIAQDVQSWSNDGTTMIDMPKDGVIRVYIPWIWSLKIEADKEFKRLWIWSLPGKNFVCIEPVMGDEGAIVNNPPVVLEPRATLRTGIHISFDDV